MKMHIWEETFAVEENGQEIERRRCTQCGVDEKYPTEECCERRLTDPELIKVKNQMMDYKRGKFQYFFKVFH